MSGKDIEKLIKLLRNLGNSICDVGTYEERQTKYLVVKWKYKGNGKDFRWNTNGNTKKLLRILRKHKGKYRGNAKDISGKYKGKYKWNNTAF